MPSKSVVSTLYEIWKGRKPNLKHFKIWGCPAYVKNIFGYKLSARSDKYRFVGYPKKTNEYYYYLLNKRCLLVGTSFFKKINSSKKEAVGGILNLLKFIIYNSIQKYQWLDRKKILNQKYLKMRYIHNTHLFSEG